MLIIIYKKWSNIKRSTIQKINTLLKVFACQSIPAVNPILEQVTCGQQKYWLSTDNRIVLLFHLHVGNMQISVDTYIQSTKCVYHFSLLNAVSESIRNRRGALVGVGWGGGCITSIFHTEYLPAQCSGRIEGHGCQDRF